MQDRGDLLGHLIRSKDDMDAVVAQQVTHRLLLGRWDTDRGELAGAEEPAELARIAAVGLDPLALALGDGRRSDDLVR